MYNININFLKDRKLDTAGTTTSFKKKPTATLGDRIPIFIGAGVGVAFIGAVGGALFLLNNQKANQTRNIAQLDAEIQRLQGQNQQVQQIEAEIANVDREISILGSVFTSIKPWSAMLAEIASVTPSGVKINTISQSGINELTINGYAESFDDINDFLLTLQNSPFLDGKETRLSTASRGENPATIIFDLAQLNPNSGVTGTEGNNPEVELPPVFLYTITTQIKNQSSEQLLNLLARRGAMGLVSRLTALQRKGVLQLVDTSTATETETTETKQAGETAQ